MGGLLELGNHVRSDIHAAVRGRVLHEDQLEPPLLRHLRDHLADACAQPPLQLVFHLLEFARVDLPAGLDFLGRQLRPEQPGVPCHQPLALTELLLKCQRQHAFIQHPIGIDHGHTWPGASGGKHSQGRDAHEDRKNPHLPHRCFSRWTTLAVRSRALMFTTSRVSTVSIPCCAASDATSIWMSASIASSSRWRCSSNAARWACSRWTRSVSSLTMARCWLRSWDSAVVISRWRRSSICRWNWACRWAAIVASSVASFVCSASMRSWNSLLSI